MPAAGHVPGDDGAPAASDDEAISASLAMVDAADTAPARSRALMQWVHNDKGSGWSKGKRGLRIACELRWNLQDDLCFLLSMW